MTKYVVDLYNWQEYWTLHTVYVGDVEEPRFLVSTVRHKELNQGPSDNVNSVSLINSVGNSNDCD